MRRCTHVGTTMKYYYNDSRGRTVSRLSKCLIWSVVTRPYLYQTTSSHPCHRRAYLLRSTTKHTADPITRTTDQSPSAHLHDAPCESGCVRRQMLRKDGGPFVSSLPMWAGQTILEGVSQPERRIIISSSLSLSASRSSRRLSLSRRLIDQRGLA